MLIQSAVIKGFPLLCFCAMLLVAALHEEIAAFSTSGSSRMVLPPVANLDVKGGAVEKHGESYDWSRSTEDNYRDEVHCQQYGKYTSLRKTLDYSYHANYTEERQLFQDKIVDAFFDNTLVHDRATGQVCSTPSHPWIVFTAGCMGAGKSWTIRTLSRKGYFPLNAFVTVDPDEIRRHLPEFATYARIQPEQAGDLTRKEAGLIAEVLTLAALENGYNVLVDGSLRDAEWYQSYFARLRRDYEPLKIGILHITAPEELVYARAESRAQLTGRIVPRNVLEEALLQVPQSVARLGPMADFYAELHNAEDEEGLTIQTPGLDWGEFREAWTQSCSSSRQGDTPSHEGEKETKNTCVSPTEAETLQLNKP